MLHCVQPQARRLMIMIKREMYMKRIRPFVGTELIKVMTGIRRCGKSDFWNCTVPSHRMSRSRNAFRSI